MLAVASEPGLDLTGELVRAVGSVETVRVARGAPFPLAAHPVRVDQWRAQLAPHLDTERTRDAIAASARGGLKILMPGDDGWPTRLNDLGDQAPLALWVKGDTTALSETVTVGFAGARAATSYGDYVSGRLAADLAEQGTTVIAGGSYGIDTAAHRAALLAGGKTVAVLANGIDRMYPAGNTQMLTRIGETGALASELPPGARPTKWRFEQRGRLVAALSDALIVVEASYHSASLRTASLADELHRCVGAVPGPITSAASAGCHRLIRESIGEMVDGTDDVNALLRRSVARHERALHSHTEVRQTGYQRVATPHREERAARRT